LSCFSTLRTRSPEQATYLRLHIFRRAASCARRDSACILGYDARRDPPRGAAFLGSFTVMASPTAFSASSPDISEDAPIATKFVFDDFGCGGENVSPEIRWSGAPAGTKSFAVLVHDPDAPTGGAGFWHWIVTDIPASAGGLAQGAGVAGDARLPAGARQFESDYGLAAWGGPCPPPGHGAHRYIFTVYALGVEKIDLPAQAKASAVGFVVNQAALAKASFTGRFGR
jgi:Raf kinase inhibitor-like YbhB/YbcL family protein